MCTLRRIEEPLLVKLHMEFESESSSIGLEPLDRICHGISTAKRVHILLIIQRPLQVKKRHLRLQFRREMQAIFYWPAHVQVVGPIIFTVVNTNYHRHNVGCEFHLFINYLTMWYNRTKKSLLLMDTNKRISIELFLNCFSWLHDLFSAIL